MGVDFAAEGLLDGLDGDERAARLELLERLQAEGATLAELRSAVADGLLVVLLAERLIDGPPRHTSRDVASEAGLALAKLEAMRRAHALPVPDPDAVALTDLDVEAIRTAGAFRAAGVTDEQMLRAIRVFGRGMAQAAEDAARGRPRARARAGQQPGRARAALRRAPRRADDDESAG